MKWVKVKYAHFLTISYGKVMALVITVFFTYSVLKRIKTRNFCAFPGLTKIISIGQGHESIIWKYRVISINIKRQFSLETMCAKLCVKPKCKSDLAI